MRREGAMCRTGLVTRWKVDGLCGRMAFSVGGKMTFLIYNFIILISVLSHEDYELAK